MYMVDQTAVCPLLYYSGMPEFISLLVTVRGRVQGVSYRANTQDWAGELGIRGWVKNNADGSVTAVLQHVSLHVLEEMLSRMKKGPSLAQVDELTSLVDLRPEECRGFRILR